MAINLDMVPDEEPLMREILQSFSSRNSRLSLAQADKEFTPQTPDGMYGMDYLGVIDFPHSLAISLGMRPGSALNSSPLSSIEFHRGYTDDAHVYSLNANFTSITSSHHHQMIRDLETSQAIDLSHLANLTEQDGEEDFLVPLGSEEANLRDVLLLSSACGEKRPFLLSEWLSVSIQRIKRRHASIDEVLEPYGEQARVSDMSVLDANRRRRSKPLVLLDDLQSPGSPAGWHRLRNFWLRRRSI